MVLPTELCSFDLETHLTRPGLGAPPMVCLTWADTDGNLQLLDREDGTAWFREAIRIRSLSWCGHNVAYDMTVMMNESPDVIPWVFLAYLENRVHDTMIREQLLSIAQGKSSDAKGLADLTKKYLGRDRSASKKGPDIWRTRYAELQDIPVSEWPEAASSYALDDAADTLGILLAQASGQIWVEASGRSVPLIMEDGAVRNEYEQVRAALSLHLMSVQGLKVNITAATELRNKYVSDRDRLGLKLRSLGILSPEGKVNTKLVKRRILDALTADATPEIRQAVQRSIEAEGLAIEQQKILDLEAGKRKSKPKQWFTDTERHAAEVTAWKRMGFTLPTTDSGKAVQTGEEVLEVINDEQVELLVAYKKAEKRISTYLDPMIQSAGYALTPQYRPLVRSGRASSYEPNIMNFPRKGGERECIESRNGWLLVAADYSTLELRSWAQVCLDLGIHSEMALALREGRDLHADLASRLLGWSYERTIEALRGKHGKEDKQKAKDMRAVSKPANFGLPVGMGAAKYEESARKSYDINFKKLGIDPEWVREIWYDRWTEASPYFGHVSGLLVTTGYKEVEREDPETGERWTEMKAIRKCTIEHPRSHRVRGGCYFTDAANSYFQGMAADGAKAALFQIAMECYALPDSPLYGSRPIAFIHDEVIIESPIDKARGACDRLEDVMRSEMSKFIPDLPIVCDGVIMDRWAKDAEPAEDEEGNVIRGVDRPVYWFEAERARKTDERLARRIARAKYNEYGLAAA